MNVDTTRMLERLSALESITFRVYGDFRELCREVARLRAQLDSIASMNPDTPQGRAARDTYDQSLCGWRHP